MQTMTRPLVVQGPHQNRSEVRKGEELWNLSLQQEMTIDGGTLRLADIMSYVKDLAVRARNAALPKCTLWKRIKNTPCYDGEAP